jgi:hypothetical protein
MWELLSGTPKGMICWRAGRLLCGEVWTGLRVSELIGLKGEDVAFSNSLSDASPVPLGSDKLFAL